MTEETPAAVVTTVPEVPELRVAYCTTVNYAFQQNAVPVVHEILFRNGATALRDIVVRVTTEPPFAPPHEYRFAAVAPYAELRIAPVELKLSPEYLDSLRERVAGWMTVAVLEGDAVVAERKESIALLARNEWCGLVALPEILAAFVLPNDPAVMTVLGRAAELLRDSTGRAAFNGYRDRNRKRAWEQVAAIYRAISELRIRYINPPASFETSGQKVRFPSDIVAERFGTCLDLSLLVAACCEQAGLHPLVLMHEGHAYAGCWLEEQTMKDAASDDLQHVRKLVTSDAMAVLETTVLTAEAMTSLADGEREARKHLTTTAPFRLALDVRRARIGRVYPLPIPGQRVALGAACLPCEARTVGLGDRAVTEALVVEVPPAPKPATRIDIWKSRLLDLTLRNRLLNFRETKATVPILSASPEHVEDGLAGDVELALRPRPALMGASDPRDAGIHSAQRRTDAVDEHLREELRQQRIHTALDELEHARRLTELYRSARNAIDENGSNILYLAVGMLEWRETEHGDRSMRAPLLLVPVELKRKSVVEGFTLRRLDEETRLNVTLMEMLRQNFQKQIAGLDPLPEDETGVNVARVLAIFREAVRDMPGWEVRPELWLGLFSFTKFLLWKDLSDRLDDLTRNRVVRHLVEEAGTPFANAPDDIEARDLDERFRPAEIYVPRSADSSQLAAVMAAAAGQDFVLEGPPGTGKSQTITNIIAHCLAKGKRVLFVAEKRAALDVVYRRLREDGLEPFCLELHSNKSGKKEVLEQFDRSLRFASEALPEEWARRASELEAVRASLNAYVKALHRRHACGLSAYQCLDYLLPRQEQPVARLVGWDRPLEVTGEQLDMARETARLLQERARPLAPLATHGLRGIAATEWTPTWQERSFHAVEELRDAARTAQSAAKAVAALLAAPRTLTTKAELTRLAALAEPLLAPEPVAAGFVTGEWSSLGGDLERLASAAEARSVARGCLAPLLPAHGGKPGLVCEAWEESELRNAMDAAGEAEQAASVLAERTQDLLQWLRAPGEGARLSELGPLAAFAESLLGAPALGPEFAAAPWHETTALLDKWIALARERADLRARLAGYTEPTLLALDLDGLSSRWQRARGAWFLPKFFGMRAVRQALRTARADGIAPAPDSVEQVLATAQRLRAVTAELAGSREAALRLLGATWREGEPQAGELESAKGWGAEFHARMAAVAQARAGWASALPAALTTTLQQGPAALTEHAPAGRRLRDFRSAVAVMRRRFEALSSSAALRREPVEQSADFAGAVLAAARDMEAALPKLLRATGKVVDLARVTGAALGELWRDGEPDPAAVRRAKQWGDGLHKRMAALAGSDTEWLAALRVTIGTWVAERREDLAATGSVGSAFTHLHVALPALESAIATAATTLHTDRASIDQADDHAAEAAAFAERITAAWSHIREWCSWQRVRQDAEASGLAALVAAMESGTPESSDIPGLFERSFRRALLNACLEADGALRTFFGNEHAERIERFRKLDDTMQRLSREMIRARLAAGIPREQSATDIPKAELGLLRKEIGKKTRHIAVRKLLGGIPTLLPRLKPCLLTSPLSVAQYLDPAQGGFDVVIFDEASQIPVWDAVGAIARGAQLIVVGDPKQLPPTSFFEAGDADEDDRTPEEHKDLESILDELLTNGLRHKRLQWHYRSRHESLITFSNRAYYQNELLTFPSPEAQHGGVRFRHLPEARYDRGKSRTNRIEAEALVAELVARLRAGGPARSYGVVTFSQTQQALVENLLDEERRKYPEIEVHFSDECPIEGEPVFVKNLENVQGDERDVILFSICYGPDDAGKVSMNFGPLNRAGGERRLNVAITRAKHEVIVFSGLHPSQIDLSRTRAKGVGDLKLFLDFAERGPRALAAAATGIGEAESEFERMVAERIRAAGYEVHHQVGCSDYRIDLAVVDPDAPGRYLLGIECDGATYHRAATARDRDKLRQAILEGLGWKLHRIWSTDWWHHREEETQAVLQAIRQARVQPSIAEDSLQSGQLT